MKQTNTPPGSVPTNMSAIPSADLNAKSAKDECSEAYRCAYIHANLLEAHRKATNEADGSVKSSLCIKTDNIAKKVVRD